MINNQAIILSIIIPVYKVEKYIQRCLDSIFSQEIDEKYYEVIVVNDGTPDNSMDIVARFASEHTNVVLINQENQGLSVARNIGLTRAKGCYIWFVDSDDWLVGDSIGRVLSVIQQNDYDIISSDLIYSYDDDNHNWSIKRKTDSVVSPYTYLINYPVGAVQRYIINRIFLINNNLEFYPGIYHEDAEFAPRMVALSRGVLMLGNPIYHYYQRENSIMSSWKLKNTQDYCFVAKKHLLYSDSISSNELREAFRYFTLMVYLHAFPKNQLEANPEVKSVYDIEKKSIRKLAISMVNTRLPFRKRLKVGLCIINPWLVIPRH